MMNVGGDSMKTAELIKLRRKAAGLTQNQLAERMRITQGSLTQYETGRRKPKPETLHKFAAALQCDDFDLIGSDYKISKNDYSRMLEEAYKPQPFMTQPYEYRPQDRTQFDKLKQSYDSLNAAGRQKLVDYASDLASMKKYQSPEKPSSST